MLHKVELPDCQEHLHWIVELQRTLITALCDVNCRAEDICVEWAINVVRPLGVDENWFRRFCGWSHEKVTFLARMQQVANLDADTKRNILSAFEHDQNFEAAFASHTTQPHNLIGLQNLSQDARSIIQKFAESFYDPGLYRGYSIPSEENFVQFSRASFVDAFIETNKRDERENPVSVCVMCDGNLGNAVVDHYYPKSQYPYLSCHPRNLIPICSDCNGSANKGDRPPLSLGEQDETLEWFHPYLRPAAGTFVIEFQRNDSRLIPVLTCQEPLTQARLDNHMALFNLKRRWAERLDQRVRATQRRIRKEKSRRGGSLSRQELLEKLGLWAEDMESDIGIIPHALIDQVYFAQGAAEVPDVFDVLMEYCQA